MNALGKHSPVVSTIVLGGMMFLSFGLEGISAFAETSKEQETRIANATTVLKQFLSHLEARRYDACYDLFSAKYRAALRKESGVRDRNDYRRMSLFRGLHWHTPTMGDVKIVASGGSSFVVVFVDMTFVQHIWAERTATERLTLTFVLVEEKGRWVVDAWS